MARLARDQEAGSHLLRTHNVVGRAGECTLCLREPEVSALHASLAWSGAAWVLQDLTSRNGTFVAGRRLALGERVAVPRGAQIGFGRPSGWVLTDDAPPQPFAQPQPDGPPVPAIAGILALPSAEQPAATIFHDGPHGWRMELRGDVQAVEDGHVLDLVDQRWRLILPQTLPATWEDTSDGPSIERIALCFAVTRDEEYVELVATHGTHRFDLEARAHHYVLLVLARRRLEDQQRADLPVSEHGWIHQDALLDMLRIDVSRLHIDVYRARRQLSEAGIHGATRLIERRAGTRMLRLGVPRAVVKLLTR